MAPQILLDKSAAEVLAQAVIGKARPATIRPVIWLGIIKGIQTAVDVADLGAIMDLVADPALIYRMKEASEREEYDV